MVFLKAISETNRVSEIAKFKERNLEKTPKLFYLLLMAKEKNEARRGQAQRGAENCQQIILHPDMIAKVQKKIPAEELLKKLGDFFKIVGDPTRIKILQALAISELCVCDIAQVTGASQSTVSHNVKTLRQTNLVKYRKEGKTVFYSLSDEHVTQILEVGLIHIQE